MSKAGVTADPDRKLLQSEYLLKRPPSGALPQGRSFFSKDNLFQSISLPSLTMEKLEHISLGYKYRICAKAKI